MARETMPRIAPSISILPSEGFLATAGGNRGRQLSRGLARWTARLCEQAAQDKPAVCRALREAPHEIGAPVGAKRNVDLQSVSGGVHLFLKVASNSINHLKFVAGFVQLEPCGFGLGVCDHIPVVRRDGRQERALS